MFEDVLNKDFEAEARALIARAEAEALLPETAALVERARKRYAAFGGGDVLRAVNMAYVAERFFGKSRSWLCHKLNHSAVNGKPARFTEAEAQRFREALETLADELQALAEDMQFN